MNDPLTTKQLKEYWDDRMWPLFLAKYREAVRSGALPEEYEQPGTLLLPRLVANVAFKELITEPMKEDLANLECFV